MYEVKFSSPLSQPSAHRVTKLRFTLPALVLYSFHTLAFSKGLLKDHPDSFCSLSTCPVFNMCLTLLCFSWEHEIVYARYSRSLEHRMIPPQKAVRVSPSYGVPQDDCTHLGTTDCPVLIFSHSQKRHSFLTDPCN